MVAVVLLKGAQIETADYQNDSSWATDERVEALRQKITMAEDPGFTRDYHDPDIRSVANALSVTLSDGTQLPDVVVPYPLGHVRRQDTLDQVYRKARKNLELRLPVDRAEKIMSRLKSADFSSLPACQFIHMFHL
jgi:2-methylcitrate dehydratase